MEVTYLGSHLRLHHDPPPLVAELNPTGGSFLIGAVLKAQGLLPFTAEFPAPVAAALVALDVAGFARLWHQPVSADNARAAVRRAAVTAALAVAAAATPLARTTSADGTEVYPGIGAARDLLLVVMPNWDLLTPRQRLLGPLVVAGALGASWVRRRHQPMAWLALLTELGSLTNALALFRAANRVEEEAALLEHQLFERYAAELEAAWRAGEAEELALYAGQLDIARRALSQLGDLDPQLRSAIEEDCDHLAAWLAERQASTVRRPGTTDSSHRARTGTQSPPGLCPSPT